MSQVKFDPKEHKYYDTADREYVSVSRVIEYFGISQIDKLIAIHGQEHFDKLCLFGHEVHKLTAADDRNELQNWDYDLELEPYIQGWCNFRMHQKMSFLAIEEPLISRIWGFAGTPDRIHDAGRQIDIPDLKTGTKSIAQTIQTAFYQILAEENYGKPVRHRYTVHLDPKAPLGYRIEHHKNSNDVNIAKAMMSVYNFKKQNGIL